MSETGRIDRARRGSGENSIQAIAGIGSGSTLAVAGVLAGILSGALMTTTAYSADKKEDPAAFKPVDDGVKEPAFFLFRARLQQAIAARDTEALARLMHSKVQWADKTGEGPKAALQQLKDKPALWGKLAQILAMGGRFVDGAWTDGRKQRGFVAPYTYFAAAIGKVERQVVVVTAARVNLRKSPSVTAPVVSKLSHQIVYKLSKAKADAKEAPPRKPTDRWVNVETLSGKQGWVSRNLVRIPGGYRAYFLKEDGRWRLAAFTVK